MSFAVTSIGSVADTNARSDQTVSLRRAPMGNTLVLVGVLVSDAAGTPVEPSSVSGAGMVFSIVTSSVTYNGSAGNELHNLSLWRSMSLNPDSSVITAHFPNANTGCAMLVTEVSGVSKSGTSGANAIGHSAISEDGGNTSALTLVGPSATSTANAWFSVHGVSTSAVESLPAAKWTFVDGCAFATPSTELVSAWTTLSTGTTSTWTGNSNRRATIMAEVVLDNPAAAPVAVSAAPLGRRFRIPPVPSQITGVLGSYLNTVVRQLNSEAFISIFSGSSPNVSAITGIPGNLTMNIGSASTWTRLWIMAGSVASISTTSWHPCRVA